MLSTEDFNKMYECIKRSILTISANPYYQNSWPENYDIAFYNIVTDYRLMDMSLVGKNTRSFLQNCMRNLMVLHAGFF